MSLKRLLVRLGLRQAHMARRLGVSPGTFADLVNHGRWPRRQHDLLRQRLVQQLQGAGASAAQIDRALGALPDPAADAHSRAAGGSRARRNVPIEGASLLLKKQTLTPAARQQFGLARDPFGADLRSPADVFLTPDFRYVRQAMWDTACHGGMLAVVGESGAGKSTLRRELLARIRHEQARIVVIEPYVLAMEESDQKGKTLKSAHIAEALLRVVQPLAQPRRSPEARFAQLHQILRESHRSGTRHLLVIEEAHCLPTATLKHLKRFLELEDGFEKLLAVVLIGQPELRQKLSEKSLDVREVVQRCEIAELAPLGVHLGEYLAFRLARAGGRLESVFDDGAIDALRQRLTISSKSTRAFGPGETTSLVFPLAVNNLASAAMNLANSIGAARITAELVGEV